MGLLVELFFNHLQCDMCYVYHLSLFPLRLSASFKLGLCCVAVSFLCIFHVLQIDLLSLLLSLQTSGLVHSRPKTILVG